MIRCHADRRQTTISQHPRVYPKTRGCLSFQPSTSLINSAAGGIGNQKTISRCEIQASAVQNTWQIAFHIVWPVRESIPRLVAIAI